MEMAGRGNGDGRRQQLARMRPTLVVGAGGSGQIVLTCLKAALQARFADEWRSRIRLLAVDTTEETFQIQGPQGLVTLEAGAEFFDIGDVPISSIVRNIDSQTAIKERLGPVMSKLPAGVLRSGSKQLRPLGLLSLLWNHPIVNEQIQRALWQLAGRSQNEALNQQQGINVFICGSLVGGTGSGAMFDLAYLIRDAFTDLGTQAEFCHITGVGVLPQAFHGIKGPNMLPNTAAALQELNHLMVKGQFQVRYPDGRLVDSRESPFDIFYVVDGVDQAGRTWADIYAVCAMAAQCIYLQMGTQLGQKGENAFDNLDEVLTGLAADGQGTFLGSFGKGDLLFDAPAAAQICARWLLLEHMQQAWLASATPKLAAQQAEPLLAQVKGEQLRPSLRQDPDTSSEFRIELTQPGWLGRKPVADIPGETSRYISEYGQARLTEKMLPQIGRNGQTLAEEIQPQWSAWLHSLLFAPDTSLDTTLAALQQLRGWLAERLQAAQAEAAEQERQQARLEQNLLQAETALSKAATSFPIGRNGRVRDALTQTFRAAQGFYEMQLRLQTGRAEMSLWQVLHQWTRTKLNDVAALRERLAALAPQLEEEASRQAQQIGRGGIAALSLADGDYLQVLYGRHKPTRLDVKERLGDLFSLSHLDSTALSQPLLAAFLPAFDAIAAMTVEDAIRDRSEEMSPRARRQQLFQLATPSWNVDRARLPEGGANLVRLEVLGVCDATNSLFEGEPMLVSTHDPHRLTALVVAAGAPPSALQQYGQYMQALEQARGKRPLYVLPDFLVTADQGRLFFALGSIFNLIYNQGAYFYYQPADPLQPPLRLANGLSNALHIFSEQEELVSEVGERVEGHIARLGLREAITILTDYYTSAPNGNTALDEQLRELKRLVRDYADSLRRIDAFSAGIQMRDEK
jgi:hypothetical protein